jgi:fatty-acyl-CoA synthase
VTVPHPDLVRLTGALAQAEPARGILLVDSRFQESFHPYADVFRRVRALARQFREQGVGPGDRVLIPLATDMTAIGSFLALVHLGALPFSVTAPLIGQDREAHRRQMVRLIAMHGVSRLLETPDLAGIAGAYPEAPAEMALRAAPPTPEELADDRPVPAHAVAPDDVAFVQFSSGSTSHPKGVRITHRGLVTNVGLIADTDRRTARSVWVSWLPLYHDMGLVGGLLSNFVHQNPLVLMHPRCFVTRPVSWLSAVSRHRGTVTAIPNFALDICTSRISDEQLEEAALDLSSFRFIYNGSEPVRVGSLRRFEARFTRHGYVPGSVYPVYGMAETTLITSAPAFGEPEVVRRVEGMEVPSVGYPLGDFDAQVRADDGRALGAGEVGEIHLRGTCVTPGYLETGGGAAGLIRDGWLSTGDLGMLDEAGRLYITGRKKDLIIVQGRNFYGHDVAATVEEGLSLRPGTAYVFSTDVDDEERVVVMIAAAKGGGEEGGGPPADPAVLRDRVRDVVLREFGLVVHDVHLVQRLPKTTSGKIARHTAQKMYEEATRQGGFRR